MGAWTSRERDWTCWISRCTTRARRLSAAMKPVAGSRTGTVAFQLPPPHPNGQSPRVSLAYYGRPVFPVVRSCKLPVSPTGGSLNDYGDPGWRLVSPTLSAWRDGIGQKRYWEGLGLAWRHAIVIADNFPGTHDLPEVHLAVPLSAHLADTRCVPWPSRTRGVGLISLPVTHDKRTDKNGQG